MSREVAEQGYGYLEDRRPSSNCDPYRVGKSFQIYDENSCHLIKLEKTELKMTYSESQINEYITRTHKMSSLKFILKCMTAVMLPHWSAQIESCLDVRSFKGLNMIYENISKYHCS